jgi:hypothetical protein
MIWGRYSYVEWMGNTIEVEIGPMARLLRVPNSRLKEYLQWLETNGYIESLIFTRGRASMDINLPDRLTLTDGGIEFELDVQTLDKH